MDLPIEKVQVTQAEIDTAISAGGYLTVSQLGLGIKEGYNYIYTGTKIENTPKFTVGTYPTNKYNISSLLSRNLTTILGDDIKVDSHFLGEFDGENGEKYYPCEHRITIKNSEGVIIFNVTIEVVLEQMINVPATASDPVLGPLRLKTQRGVVFTLSGEDAQFCKYFLLGDFYNALRYFSPDFDQTKKHLLLLHAFNHPSVPMQSHEIMQEMIPVVIDAILPAAAPPGTLTNQFNIKIQRTSSKQYRDHFQSALASDDYSGVGKLLIISALLMGNMCNEVMITGVKVKGLGIPLETLCKTTLKDFLYKLSSRINCQDHMANLIEDIYNKTISLVPGKFKETFHARIQALATRMEKTTVLDLLPVNKTGNHVMADFLSSIFTTNDYSILNWNLKSSKAMDYDEVATFLLRTTVDLKNDFLTLQNVTEPFTLCEFLPDGFNQRWGNMLHTNYSSMIFFDKQRWQLIEDPLNNVFDNEIQPCFFENLQDASKKLLILNFNRKQNRTLAQAEEDVDLITTLKERYPTFIICGVGFFNYPIPVSNATGISAIASYDNLQSHSKEACFEIAEEDLLQVVAQTLDTLNPGRILERPLLPMHQISTNIIKTPTVKPQQYQFCLFNIDKKQYCRVSYDLFMQRLTKRLRYDEILVKAKSENPQATLIADQLFINDYGSLFLQIQIPDFLRPDLKDLLKSRLQDIGARVEETYCELQVLPLTNQYANWTEVKNPRFINHAQIITAQGAEKNLYLPDVLMREFLDNLEEMLVNASYRQNNKVLQKLYKAMHDKGAECWSYIVHICKEMIAESQSGVFGLFGYKKEPTFEDPSDLLVYAIAHTEEHLQRYDLLTNEKKLAIQQHKMDILISYCRGNITKLAQTINLGVLEPRFSVAKTEKMLLENLQLALESFSDSTIMNLKQLVIAEQKEQFKAFFAREVIRLTPRKEVAVPGKALTSKATNDKIAAYENLSNYVDLHPLSHEISKEVIYCLESMKVISDGVYFPSTEFPTGILIGIAIQGSTGYSKEPTSLVNYRKTTGALTSTFTTPLWDCFKLGSQHEINSEYRDWLVIEESSEDKEPCFDDTPETPDNNRQLN